MAVAGKGRLLVLCVSAIAAFIVQSMSSFAEHTGLIRCVADVEHQQSAGSSDPQTNAHCSHTHSHGAMIAVHTGSVSGGGLLGKISLKVDAPAPDGPVRDIDYPPQLS
jgi:hypothetical protein